MAKQKTTFTCPNMKIMKELAPGALSNVANKIYAEACTQKKKYVNLTRRECANDLPVIENWWKGMNKEKRGTVPANFHESVVKKVRCGLE